MTADMKAAMEFALSPYHNDPTHCHECNLVAAFLEQQDRIKYLSAAFGAICEKHFHEDIPATCVFCALEAERKAREEAERTVGQLTISRDAATRTAARRTERAETAEQRAESSEAALEAAAEDAAASWDAARAAEQRAAELQQSLKDIIDSEKRGETAEYLAHIATRALSAQPKVAAGQEAAYPSGEDAVTSGQPAPSAAPIAHSNSQYRRLVAQGADVAPPAPDNDQPLIEYGYTPSRVNALVQDNDFESTWPAAATDTALPGLELAAKICVRIAEGKGDDPLSDYSDCAHDCAVALRAEITRRKQASNWPFKVLEP